MEKKNNFLRNYPGNCTQVKEVMFLCAQPVSMFMALSSVSEFPLGKGQQR